jgi:hypothetical protein
MTAWLSLRVPALTNLFDLTAGGRIRVYADAFQAAGTVNRCIEVQAGAGGILRRTQIEAPQKKTAAFRPPFELALPLPRLNAR